MCAASAVVVRLQTASITCGELVITVNTLYANHLWLIAAYTDPLISPQVPPPDLAPRVHRLRFDFVVEYGLEQEESGNTFVHTFRIRGVIPFGRLYYTLVWEYVPARTAATTPIYAIDVDYSALVRETWPGNVGGDWGWTPTTGTGGHITWNKGSVTLTGSGVPSGAGLSITTASIPSFSPTLPCNSYVSAAINHGPLPFNQGYATLTFEQQRGSPAYFGQATLLVNGGQNAGNVPRTIYDEATASSPLAPGWPSFQLLGQVLFHAANGKQVNSSGVDQSVPVTTIIINATTNVLGVPPATTSLNIGPITLGTVQASPIRRDRTWRTIRNPIFKLYPLGS